MEKARPQIRREKINVKHGNKTGILFNSYPANVENKASS
jgi:hypothetical protein